MTMTTGPSSGVSRPPAPPPPPGPDDAKAVAILSRITAGPDTLELLASIPVEGENLKTVAKFSVAAGGSESFVLNYRPSHRPAS